MQQPLATRINLMNRATTDCLASCEIYVLLRLGPLLPKITNPPSSVDLFVQISVPVTNQYPHKRAINVPYPPACQ